MTQVSNIKVTPLSAQPAPCVSYTPAECAAALVREVVAARSELTARHVAYVPPAEWAKEIQHG